ncbi:MAG TPA: DoxX family protein [Chloroflexota bacterium]|nr:DoxX family protein [Chloroflexota bacterium]
MAGNNNRTTTLITDPPIAQLLFNDTRLSWLWLIVRLYVGYSWLTSGLGKVTNPAWTVTGEALRGFWTNAVQIPAQGNPQITFGWYRDFITFLLNGGHYVWFAKLIVFGELAIGTALILGAFTGIAAFFGAFMNWNFLLAGTSSVNPILFTLSILLMLAWKTAGYIGVDRWLLPRLGTPWGPNIVTRREVEEAIPHEDRDRERKRPAG